MRISDWSSDVCSSDLDDWTTMAAVTAAIGYTVQIIGDDVLVTNAERVARAGEAGVCNAALIKVNQVGTVTEAKAALDAAVARGWGAIVSARSGESEDVTIAHLATGWNAGQLKVGSFTRSERMAKWNEMLRIEEKSEEHTSELQSLMRISYAVFCLKQKKPTIKKNTI